MRVAIAMVLLMLQAGPSQKSAEPKRGSSPPASAPATDLETGPKENGPPTIAPAFRAEYLELQIAIERGAARYRECAAEMNNLPERLQKLDARRNAMLESARKQYPAPPGWELAADQLVWQKQPVRK